MLIAYIDLSRSREDVIVAYVIVEYYVAKCSLQRVSIIEIKISDQYFCACMRTEHYTIKNGNKVVRGRQDDRSTRSGNISHPLMVASGGEKAIYSMDTDGRLRGG